MITLIKIKFCHIYSDSMLISILSKTNHKSGEILNYYQQLNPQYLELIEACMLEKMQEVIKPHILGILI